MGIWAKKNKYCNTGLWKGKVKKTLFKDVEKGIWIRNVKTPQSISSFGFQQNYHLFLKSPSEEEESFLNINTI